MARVRVPHIAMYESAECGAACLAMILAKWGCWVPLQELRDACGVSRDGADAGNLKRAAIAYGMQAESVLADIDEFGALMLPCIVHVDMEHFVVLLGYSKRHVWISDPAAGTSRIPLDAFKKRYTGIAVVLCPGPDFKKRPKEKGTGTIILSLLAGAGPFLLGIGWLTLLGLGLGMAAPYLTQFVVDHVLPKGSLGMVLGVGAVASVAFLLLTVVELLRGLVVQQMRAKLDTGLMRTLVTHLFSLPVGYFLRRSPGALASRITMLSGLRSLVGERAISAAFDLASAVTFTAVLARVSLWCIPAALLYGATYFAVFKVYLAVVAAFYQARVAQSGAAFGVLQEAQVGIETVKAMGAEQRLLERWCSNNAAFAKSECEIRESTALLNFGGRLLAEVFLLATTGVAAFGFARGQVTAGAFALAVVAARSLVQVVTTFTRTSQSMGDVLSRFASMEDIMSAASERPDGAQPEELRGHFRVEGLHFAYGTLSPDVLTDVSFDVLPGEMVGIVGPSGSGKTTLVKCLVGLFEPKRGRVSIDGLELSSFDLGWLRTRVGFVLQDSFLFDATAEWNITLGAKTEQGALEDACAAAGILARIKALPEGFQTNLGEGGKLLSGGERQRLALARALYKNPSVLVLDEASSALDLATERTVHAALVRLRCTRLVIAHRLETLRGADRIILMDQGRIAQTGTFHELFQTSPMFRGMCTASGTQVDGA